MPSIITVDWVPPFARGLLRDLRLRWAMEEAGLAYEMKFVPLGGRDEPSFRALQPFGQIPAYEEDGKTMFETGAILLHLAAKSDTLAPTEPDAKTETTTWLFAALNTIEPHLQNLVMIDRFHREKDWYDAYRIVAVETAVKRLGELSAVTAKRQWLAADRFTIADIAMTTVLRIVDHTDLVAQYGPLAAYKARCEARPAFQKSLADQLADIDAHAPAL